MLVGNAVQEIGLNLNAATAGTMTVDVNIVDADSHSLIGTWQVGATVAPPALSKVNNKAHTAENVWFRAGCMWTLLAPVVRGSMCVGVPATHHAAAVQAFELIVPLGKQAKKRVNYRNPYLENRIFKLSTDRPDLIMFQNKVLYITS